MSRYLIQQALTSRKAERNDARDIPVRLSSDTESFYERLGEDADVRLEPGIDQDEVFDDQFERRAHEIQRTPSAASAISVIPTKKGPWSGNNQLGIERFFAPDDNNRQTIIKLDEWGFPEVWTLVLGLVYNADLYDPSNSFFSVTAEVEFGAGGCIQTVELDWLQGTTIALPMNALNVVASFNSSLNEAGIPNQLPSDLRLRANLVRGSLSNGNPTRSYLAEGVDPVVPVPPYAKSVRIVPRAFGGTAFSFYTSTSTVNFMSGDPHVFPTSAILATLQRCQFVEYINVLDQLLGKPVYIDIPEGSRFLQLSDAGGVGPTNIQFRLGV